MGIIRKIVEQGIVIRNKFTVNKPKAYDLQTNVLRNLIEKAQDTEFGKEHNFRELYFSPNIVEEYRKTVPLSNYSLMYPYWKRAYEGEPDICWPGQTMHFALSSGTSEGASKYIPVTKDMVKAIKKASLRQILAIAKSDLPKEFITKHSLMMGGSTDLHFNGICFSGDLSGITQGSIPFWFQPFSKPDKRIMKRRNWEEKIEEMVLEAKKWDVGMIAGVPAWIQILFERIIAHYNLKTIHDIWPNFKVYVHGGVALGPYKKSFEKLLGEPIMYFETYLASEGFIAYQTSPEAKGMALQLKNGIYFEFIPYTDENFTEEGDLKPDATTLSIMDVEPNKDYALIMSTCSGAWRYMIGDVVRFTSQDEFEVVITGRTKHFLSLCGEHLSVDNMNKAVALVANDYNIDIKEFTVAGIPHNGMFAHHWYLGVEAEFDKTELKEKLDGYLKQLNDDYAVERNHALNDIIVDTLPHDLFIEFLKTKGKVGSQNKFPRVLKGEIVNEWKEFLQRSSVQVS